MEKLNEKREKKVTEMWLKLKDKMRQNSDNKYLRVETKNWRKLDTEKEMRNWSKQVSEKSGIEEY